MVVCSSGHHTIIIADDHPFVRQGVRMLLETHDPGCHVIEAADLDSALAAVSDHPDAILLIDLDMPGMHGTQSLHALRQGFPELIMAVLSGNTDRQVILEAVGAGVNGYIPKSGPATELLQAIEIIRTGQIYLQGTPFQDNAPPAPELPLTPKSKHLTLTPRQVDVIRQLMQGRSNKEIALALAIEEGTVKIHMAGVFRSLGARNRTEAGLIGTKLGL